MGWCARYGRICPDTRYTWCGPETNYSECKDFRKVTVTGAYEETDQDGKRRIYLTAPKGYALASDDKGLPRDPGAQGKAPDNRSDSDAAQQ